MSINRFWNNFTGGELTPLLDGRSDLQQYDRGCRRLENMRPLPYGGATMRAGLEHIEATKLGITAVARVVPFNFSTGTRFVLEFGDAYIRFYTNGAQVESSPGVPYEIVSPFSSGVVFQLQFKQINDVVYITHPLFMPQKLSRFADTNWTIDEVDWTYPALREENITDTEISVAATSGTGVGMTATDPIFDPAMVGGYWELRHLRDAEAEEISLAATSGTVTGTALTVKGDWQLVTTERWYGTLELQRSTDGGATWRVARRFKSSADRNVSASGTEIQECQLRLEYTATGDPYGAAVWVGTAPTNYVKANAKLESTEAYASGLVKIVGYTDASNVTVDILQTVSSTSPTDVWSEGAWSEYRGFPRAVGLFEQRLFFGGNAEKPIRFWGSKTGDFENFSYTEDDDGALAFDVASTESNPIQWIESLQRLILASTGSESSVGSGDAAEPLTPSNVSVRDQSFYGSSSYQPIKAGDTIIYMQRQQRKLREISYDIQRDGFISPDLTLLAEHITAPNLLQLAFARSPDALVIATTSPGAWLAVMTYNREQQITAWAKYITDGFIESACAIYGDSADEIWCVVRRVMGDGSSNRFVERFTVETNDKRQAKLLDCYSSGTIAGAFSGTITGLGQLEGLNARLVMNGAVIGDFLVTSGQMTGIPTDGIPDNSTWVAGRPYTAVVQPMKMNVVLANGPSQGKRRRVSEARISFYQTVYAKFGMNMEHLEEIDFRQVTDGPNDSPNSFTGDKILAFPGTNEGNGDVIIVQDQPLPITVLGILAKAEFLGD